MPYSYTKFKDEVRDHIVDNFPSELRILDVGPGSGSYGHMLKPHYPNIDALEIFPEYIKMFNLRDVYRSVIEGDILTFDGLHDYDYIIMGDVLEHIPTGPAIDLVTKIHFELRKFLLIAVPYEYQQGEEFNNIHETHHQPDLTVGLFYQRYPMMRLIYGDNNYGYFINYIPPKK